jgi:hypothetical protein
MYCPKCGHHQASEELRFCSRCGFKLGVIKAYLAEEEADAPSVMTHEPPALPNHKVIGLGVALSFLASLFSAWATFSPLEFKREGGYLILAMLLCSIVAFSNPLVTLIHRLFSWKQPPDLSIAKKELGFGVVLMLLGTVASAYLSGIFWFRMKTPQFFMMLVAAFVILLLVAPHLLKLLRNLLNEEPRPATLTNATSVVNVQSGGASDTRALPPSHSVPVSILETPRIITAEIAVPSITEHTTNLLNDK